MRECTATGETFLRPRPRKFPKKSRLTQRSTMVLGLLSTSKKTSSSRLPFLWFLGRYPVTVLSPAPEQVSERHPSEAKTSSRCRKRLFCHDSKLPQPGLLRQPAFTSALFRENSTVMSVGRKGRRSHGALYRCSTSLQATIQALKPNVRIIAVKIGDLGDLAPYAAGKNRQRLFLDFLSCNVILFIVPIYSRIRLGLNGIAVWP